MSLISNSDLVISYMKAGGLDNYCEVNYILVIVLYIPNILLLISVSRII